MMIKIIPAVLLCSKIMIITYVDTQGPSSNDLKNTLIKWTRLHLINICCILFSRSCSYNFYKILVKKNDFRHQTVLLSCQENTLLKSFTLQTKIYVRSIKKEFLVETLLAMFCSFLTDFKKGGGFSIRCVNCCKVFVFLFLVTNSSKFIKCIHELTALFACCIR